MNGKGRADLHVHTIYSDGMLHPRDIISKAMKKGLSAVAVTDHDCIDGVAPCLRYARNRAIEVIPGIEFSSFYGNSEVHILGYFIDTNSPSLRRTLAVMKENRRIRFARMLQLLADQGIQIDRKDAEEQEREGTVGRLNLARLLIRNSTVNTIKAAFDRFLGTGKSCYVPHKKIYVREAVEIIHSSGGCAVLAHPGTIRKTENFNDIVASGIDGIEVYHPKHRPFQEKKYLRITEQRGLIASGGSDFHGRVTNAGEPDIGDRFVSGDVVDKLRAYSEKYTYTG